MSEHPPEPRPLVLLAEDEPLASMALRAQLEALDYRVLGPARDGDEAIALGACFPVDVGIFDLRMPVKSGIEAAAELFEIAPTPVVLLTGVGISDLPDPLPRPPIFEVLNKPVGLHELGVGIEAALARFQGWSRNRDVQSALGADHRETRVLIGRAIDSLGSDRRPATSAVRLLQRAREEDRGLADIAREILDGATP